jgi:hypothetical protein
MGEGEMGKRRGGGQEDVLSEIEARYDLRHGGAAITRHGRGRRGVDRGWRLKYLSVGHDYR